MKKSEMKENLKQIKAVVLYIILVLILLVTVYELRKANDRKNTYKLYKTKTKSGREIKYIIDEKNNRIILENNPNFEEILKEVK